LASTPTVAQRSTRKGYSTRGWSLLRPSSASVSQRAAEIHSFKPSLTRFFQRSASPPVRVPLFSRLPVSPLRASATAIPLHMCGWSHRAKAERAQRTTEVLLLLLPLLLPLLPLLRRARQRVICPSPTCDLVGGYRRDDSE
ncbi:hypothetical protein CLOM_g24554, partial [Closterium sp. NIES-68]